MMRAPATPRKRRQPVRKQRIPSLISVEECLEYAAECEQCAESTRDRQARERLAEIARTWRELAEQITTDHTLH
jgi:hypothetical protein